MKRLIYLPLLLLLALSIPLGTQAQVTKSNTTGGSVNASNTTEVVNFLAGDFGGCTSLTDVNVTIHWLGGTGAFSIHEDLAIRLQSPTGTIIDLVHDAHGFYTGSGSQPVTYNGFANFGAVVTTFDDEAATPAEGSGNPAGGSYRPQNPLSGFDGENPAGNWTLSISDFANNGFGDEYIWTQVDITISCGAPAVPEIDIEGSTTSIPDGDVTPALGDDTDFGSVAIGATATNTFTIQNEGTGDLTLSGGPNFVTVSGSSLFTVTAQPSTNPIAAAGSTTFQVQFNGACPATAGPHTATVSVSSDDADESPYTFNVTATVTGVDTDSDGVFDLCDADDDNDGVADGSDPAALDPDICGDGNADGCDDCLVGTDNFGPAADNIGDPVAPTAICQNITVFLDGAGNVSITAADIDGGSSDNCNFTLSASQTSFTCADIGAQNVTLTATDVTGNTNSCVAIVTVQDSTSPVAVCQNITAFLDGTGNVSISASDLDNGSSDNCGAVSFSASQTAFTCADLGANSVTLTATDGSANTATCTGVVTVLDTVSPTLTCPGNQNESPNASCQFTLLDYTSMATANDNCGAPTVTQSPVPGTVVSANTTVTLTATDGSANSSQCQFDVILVDATNPTAVCQNITVFLDGAGNATITAADIDGGSSDNCAGLTLSASQTAFTCADIGANNVTLTATDGSSNTANCVAIVTVSDSTSPVAVCQDITVFLDGSGNATIAAGDIDAGSSDNCGVASLSVSPAAFTCADVGANTVTLTVNDGNGNSAVCTSTVTVQDTVSPTVVCQNVTVYLDGSGNATITAGDIDNGSSDNCGGALTLAVSPTAFTCADLGANSVTLTATDGDGNTGSCTGLVTVLDSTSPTAACQDITIFLDGSGNATITGGDVDAGGSDNCGSVTVTPSQTAFSCNDLLHSPSNDLIITGTYDGPLTGGTPKGVELYVVNNIADLSQYGIGSANNGGGSDGEEFTFPAVAATAGQFIYVASEAPQFTSWFGFAPDYTTGAMSINGDDAVELFFMGGVIDVFGDINQDGTGQPWEYLDGWAYRNNATGNDGTTFQLGSWSFSGINALDSETSNGTAATPFPLGTYSLAGGSGLVPVTVTFTDGSANTSTCVANVTVQDTVSPTITCPGNQTETPDASCNFTLIDYTGMASASDNCVAVTVTQSPAAGTVISGTTTITLTATDASGNTSACTFDVVLNDATAPTAVCQNISVFLDGAGTATIVPADLDGGSTDNCSGLTFSASQTSFTCADIGPNNVTLTVTDGNANTANCTAVVTVLDTVSPTAVCQNITAFLNGSGNVTITDADLDGGSSDNCGSVTFSASQTAFTCADIGPNNVTLTVDDGNGNTSTCVGIVTVSDTVSPLAVCQNVTVFLDGAGTATIVPVDVDNGSTDNCGGALTFGLSTTSYSCVDLGLNNVTLTATDANGNTGSCTGLVTVVDTVSPTAVCQNITAFLDGSGNVTIVAADIDGGSSDNCGPVTLSASQTAFTCANLGANNVTLTVTDGSSNTATCVAIVTVSDTVAPVIVCPINQTENPNASCQLVLPDYTGLGSATDNCGGTPTITQSPVPGTTISGTTTVTLTADDGNGNIANCTFDVILNDAAAPTAVCQNISVFLDGAGTATIVPADLDGGSTDNCSGLTFSASQTSFTCADIGPNNVTLTVTDGNANTANCTAVVTVLDTVSPTAVCQNITAFLDGSGNVTIVGADLDGGSSDNCGSVAFSASQTAFTCADIGPNNVTVTVDDGNGNTSTCVGIVTVSDTVSPLAVCQNVTVFLDGAGTATIVPADVDNGSTDNCGGALTLGLSVTSYTCADLGLNNVTLTATDANGNTGSCTGLVTVVDTVSPTAVCQNITAFLDGSGNVTIVAADIDGGSSDNCGPVTLSASQTAFTCANLGANNVTLTVTDGSSNTATCVAIVTVSDTVAPVIVCPINQTENPNASCQLVLPDYTGLGSATDNCGGTPTITQSPVPGTTISGTTTVTLTADDGNGNIANCTFDVILNDAVSPTAVCQNITVYLDAAGNATIVAADLDGGSTDNCSGITFTASQTAFDCSDIGAVSDTLYVTDGNGNTALCVATVTVLDSIAPTITCPGDDNLTADASCEATLPDYTGSATTSDVCDATPVVTQNPVPGSTISGAGSVTLVTLYSTDASGNVDSCSFNVTLDDVTAPTITCPMNDTVAVDAICQVALADYTGMATTTDNCDANPVVTQNPAAGTTISGSGTVQLVTLYSTDVSGNVDSCSFNVLLADSTAPAITCPVNDTIATDINCEVVLADYTGLANVLDNCDANPVVTQNPAAGMTMSGSGTVQLVTLYATDVDGNVDSCSFNVVLADSMAPVITCPVNDTVFVDANCESTLADYTGTVTTTDNCDANPVVTQSPAAGSTLNAGTTTITMTSTDADGNFATCTFDVVALDTIAPTITCMIDTTTCDTLFSFALPGAADNCSVDSVVQIAGIPSGGVYPVGSTTNTFVAYDPSGNTDTCSFVVTVDAQSTPADAGTDQNLCDVTAAILDAMPPSTGMGTWTALNGGTFTNVNDPASAVTGLTIGTYEFVWTVGQGVCTSSDTVTVIIGAGPDASFTWTESNGIVDFIPTTGGADYYLWEFGDGSSSAVEEPSYGYNPGQYIACLTVTLEGCQEQWCDTIDITTSIVEHGLFESFNVYPNPFRDNATIAYTLNGDHDVMVNVVDMQGRQITQLVNGRQAAGEYNYQFTQDGAIPSAGVYFVQLVIDGQVYTLRLIQMN